MFCNKRYLFILFAAISTLGYSKGHENFLDKIVKVRTKHGSPCTGFFIEPNVIATVTHCIDKDPKSLIITNVRGEVKEISRIIEASHESDVALLETKFQSKSFFHTATLVDQKPFNLIAWSPKNSDFISIYGKNITAKNSVAWHNAPTDGGSSGAPIIQGDKVVAVHVGTVSNSDNRVAVPLKGRFFARIHQETFELALQCRWDCSKDCCRKTILGKVCEPVCKATCETHNLGCKVLKLDRERHEAQVAEEETKSEIDAIKHNYERHQLLQKSLLELMSNFESCISDAESRNDQNGGRQCVEILLSGLNAIKNDVQDIRKEAALLDLNQLREEAKAAFEKKAEISYRLGATVENFNACWAKAVSLLQDNKEKAKQKKICLNFLLEELEIIKSAIKDESSYDPF